MAPIRMTILDRAGKFGKGIAYSTADRAHLLNVPAGNMFALRGQQDHFVNWLKEHEHFQPEKSFYPRSLYGEYISSLLAQALERARSKNIEIQLVSEEATQIQKLGGDKFSVHTGTGKKWESDVVIFALGNFPPDSFTQLFPHLREAPHYITKFWTHPIFPFIPKQSTVGIIGSGLSMIDAVLSLESRNHTGKICAFSRNGFLPRIHQPKNPNYKFYISDIDKASPLNLLKAIRTELKKIDSADTRWTDVVDALRPITNDIWARWTVAQKKQFLRRLRPYWDTHRHRMAPEVGKKIDVLQKSHQLEVIAARIRSIESNNKSISLQFQRKGTDKFESLSVDYLIDCSGPESDFRKLNEPLILSMLENTNFQIDETGMGLTSTDTQAKSNNAFVIGPLNKGQLFETTAVPELRNQAESLALCILEMLK